MLMHLTFALAFTTFAFTTASAAQPVEDVSPPIPISDTKFNAESIVLKSVGGSPAGRFTCNLEGQAKLILFSGDIEITADKIQFESNGKSLVSVICTGSCRYKQADDHKFLSGDKLTFGQDGLSVTGNARLQYGSGKNKTVLLAESISSHDGRFEVSGTALLRRSP